MKILHKYLSWDFAITFGVTLLVFTFVMCVGAVMKAIDLLARGVSGWLMLKYFLYNIPFIFTFSIPMSTLTAVLLQFGRLSFDGEMTAMKACGLSMWQVISPIVLLCLALSGVCLVLSSTVAPKSHFAQRKLLAQLGMEEPINLLDEGRFVRDFAGFMVYVAKKGRNNQLKDVVIYEMGSDGVKRSVRAKSGTIRSDRDQQALLIDLYDVRIDEPDTKHPDDPSRARYINAKHYPVKLAFLDLLKKQNVRKKTSDMTYRELIHAIRDIRSVYPQLGVRDLLRQRMAMVVEANTRLALSLTCFALPLLGIPLAMKSRRKESSVGIAISLGLVFMYYFFIILADALIDHPGARPDLIIWIPVLGFEIAGFFSIRRIN